MKLEKLVRQVQSVASNSAVSFDRGGSIVWMHLQSKLLLMYSKTFMRNLLTRLGGLP